MEPARFEEIDLDPQTLFAELLQRALDAKFDSEYSEKGNFTRKECKGRDHRHYQWRDGDKIRNEYVGPISNVHRRACTAIRNTEDKL